jgi:hypothetical protein
MGVGIIVIDYRGQVNAVKDQTLNVFQELVMAEATATLCAAEFSQDLGLHNIVLKGDSLPVINALKEKGLRWSRYGQIVEVIREVLKSLHSFLKKKVPSWLPDALYRKGSQL